MMPVFAETGPKISLTANNKPLSYVFELIESQTGYTFWYKDNVVNPEQVVSLNVKDQPLLQVVTDLIKNPGVKIEIQGKRIILSDKSPRKAPKTPVGEADAYELRGTVLDGANEPIIGASVVVAGMSVGATTNVDGVFSLTVPANAKSIVFNSVGYETKTYAFNPKTMTEMRIVYLEESIEQLGEVVVVGFGKQKKESVIGAIQSVKSSDIKLPSTNLSNSFAGRIAGVIAVQKTGEPGADGANFWIRGVGTFASGAAQQPLILIDGTEASSYDLNALAPEVIESFSILKDATATALYGSRGANGVMLITTKTGRDMAAPKINVRVEGRMSMPTQIPELADGITYMNMFNEAVLSRTPNASKPFTDDQINGTIQRLDPYVYPNVDWYNTIFKDITYNQAVNFNVTGGSKRMDYFISATLNNDMGLLKTPSQNPFDVNIQNIRYSFQGNVNSNLTKTTRVGLKLNVQMQDYKGPRNDIQYIFGRVMNAPPTYFPILFPSEDSDIIRFGNRSGGPQLNRYPNAYADLAAGIDETFTNTTMATFNIDQDLSFITEGLKIRGLAAFKNYTTTTTGRYYTPSYFEIDKNSLVLDNGTGAYSYDLLAINNDGTNAVSAANAYSGDRLINFTVAMDYQRKFKDLHEVSAALIYLQRGLYRNNPSTYNDALGQLNQGISGRLTYDFDKRYFAEFNFGWNGSDNFAKGKQFGFFPSYAVGYILSNERFFAPYSKQINLLKIRGSYGIVGNSYSSVRFPGYTNVNMSGGNYGFGENFTLTPSGAIVTNYGNENATWEEAQKYNLGIELGLYNKFTLIADLFYEDRANILMARRTVSPTIGIGSANPVANVGRVTNRGVDLSVDYHHAIRRDLIVSGKANFTYAINEVVNRDEPDYRWSYQSEYGGPLNRIGPAYIAVGLFKDQNDIDTYYDQSSISPNIKPGDIKYADLNKDGSVDEYDRTYIGNPYIPQIVYGFGGSVQYKQWDASFFFQGTAKVSIYLNDIHPFGIYHKNVMQFIADDYWSESNPNPNAAYPRLAHNVDNQNNTQASSFWLRDGSFLRLKNTEIGYSHKFIRVYLSASNLFTLTKFKYWDPEIGGSAISDTENRGNGLVYPLQRVVNLGIQLNF